MRTVVAGLIVFSALFLTGCSQKDAQAYAKQLAALLEKYTSQIDAKLADEQKRYVNEAQSLELEQEEDEQQRLTNLRTAQAKKSAADLRAGTTMPSTILTALAAYAKTDFESSRELYEKSQDAYLEHMKGLTNLTLEKAKIQSLAQSLKALAKDPGLLTQTGEVLQFGANLKDGVNLNTCSAALKAKTRSDALVTKLSAPAAPESTEEEKAANAAKLALAKADSAAAEKLAKSTGKLSADGSACK